MVDRQRKRKVWIFAVAVAAVVAYQGNALGVAIQSKVDAQARINERLSIHVHTFEALEKQTQGWDDGLDHVSGVRDLLGLYTLFDISQYGMQAALDTFALTSSSIHTVNAQDIGIVEVCVGSGRHYLEVSAHDYSTLIEGFAKMAEKPGVSFSAISLSGGTEIPTAQISDVCLLMRSGELSAGDGAKI